MPNLTECYDVEFDMKEPSKLTKILLVIDMEGTIYKLAFITHNSIFLQTLSI